MDKINVLIGIISLAVAVLGLLIGVIQTYRIRKLKREENADIWLTIRETKNIIFYLKELKVDDAKAAAAYTSALSLFRTQLKRAVLNEKNYSMDTIKRWKAADKVSSDWQEKQALGYLETNKIPLKEDNT